MIVGHPVVFQLRAVTTIDKVRLFQAVLAFVLVYLLAATARRLGFTVLAVELEPALG